MAVTVEQLKAEFPEFAHTNPTLVKGKIDDATAMLSLSGLGDHRDQAIKYYAAHLIATSPAGEFARLKPSEANGATTMYEQQFRSLIRGVVPGMMVI